MAAEQDDRSSENEAANKAEGLKGEKPTDRPFEEHIDIDVYDETPSGPSVTVRNANRESS
ncbi:MAG: hypothetical protein F9K24_12420 [Leptonema illini]|jgi:hypothetical protein|uniref:Uncharacterized protein n=1 Tax=Leptonema illini TaxID=183 RepID=A0A833LWW9_9LEPT|nr:MAG: hypothetical protein F9K24_12420 [Leptonema illini]PKL34851.1 MAG: hypothetical protein CVV45_01100 [Spirochaetae bacterium HGW-Spirochaetae-10]